MGTKIASIGYQLPPVRVSNADWREKFAPKTEIMGNEFTRFIAEPPTTLAEMVDNVASRLATPRPAPFPGRADRSYLCWPPRYACRWSFNSRTLIGLRSPTHPLEESWHRTVCGGTYGHRRSSSCR